MRGERCGGLGESSSLSAPLLLLEEEQKAEEEEESVEQLEIFFGGLPSSLIN